MTTPLDQEALAALTALADVWVRPVRPPAGTDDRDGFWSMRASDTGTPARVAAVLPELVSPEELEQLRPLFAAVNALHLDRLAGGLADALLAGLGAADADARDALRALRSLTMMAHYGGVDDRGRNPTWSRIGYPGPPAPTGDAPPLATHGPPAGTDDWTLDADVVVVGSGAGGGVVAATLAAEGRDVVVLDAGDVVSAATAPGDEATALRRLYWRGGLVTTDDGNVAVLAGRTVGGGTVVNWSNWVAPPGHVRDEWADHGLEDVAGTAFDAHLRAVGDRVGASDRDVPLNRSNEALRDGAKALGWDWHVAARNVDPDREDPRATGITGHGDRADAKQGGHLTWLPDAVADGARLVARCRVERVLVEGGRAAGVVGTWTSPEGRTVPVTVRARDVVLACGALETPAVLLRSGIGGPAVGRNLRLHPVPIIAGRYPEDQEAWWGAPQGVVVDHRSVVADGHGYLLETPHWHPGLTAASVSWPSARAHKVLMGRLARLTTFIAVTRERGGGTVELGPDGEAHVTYPLDDPFDRWLLGEAVRDLVRLHAAAGADAIVDIAPGRALWRRGQDVEAFADRMAAVPFGADGRVLFSAHQMGTARMGRDPVTSVADVDGQLHDVPGVWIGDTSAFPTAVGSNPMLTTMALARRTATRIAAG